MTTAVFHTEATTSRVKMHVVFPTFPPALPVNKLNIEQHTDKTESILHLKIPIRLAGCLIYCSEIRLGGNTCVKVMPVHSLVRMIFPE